jgi:hypothetical protein
MGAMLLQCLAVEHSGVNGSLRSGVSIAGSLFMHESNWRGYLWMWSWVKNWTVIRTGLIQRFLAPFSFRIDSWWDDFFFCVDNVDPNVARKLFMKNWEPLSIELLRQLRSAFEPSGLTSRDGSKVYARGMSSIKIPLLLLSGEVDQQCPPVSVEQLSSLISTSTYECVGRTAGQKEQYGHFDLILGLNAHTEVWNRVMRYLEANDS